MQIQYTPEYARKNNVVYNRFIVTAESTNAAHICGLINPFLVSDSSITCKAEGIKWGLFVEHRGQSTVVYEIPEKYTDAFNLYLKALQIGFPDV